MKLTEIIYKENTYTFNKPLTLEVKYTKKIVTLINEDLDFELSAKNIELALLEVYRHFNFLYQVYALEYDEFLTIEAIELKNKLLQLTK